MTFIGRLRAMRPKRAIRKDSVKTFSTTKCLLIFFFLTPLTFICNLKTIQILLWNARVHVFRRVEKEHFSFFFRYRGNDDECYLQEQLYLLLYIRICVAQMLSRTVGKR